MHFKMIDNSQTKVILSMFINNQISFEFYLVNKSRCLRYLQFIKYLSLIGNEKAFIFE